MFAIVILKINSPFVVSFGVNTQDRERHPFLLYGCPLANYHLYAPHIRKRNQKKKGCVNIYQIFYMKYLEKMK